MRGLQTANSLPVRLRITGGGAVLQGPWMLLGAVRMSHLECYEGPSLEHWSWCAGRVPGEVVLGGQKTTGIAQAWKRHDVLLTTGTLLSAVPWWMLCDAMHHHRPFEADALKAQSIDAEQCLGHLPAQPWTESLFATLSEALLSTQPIVCFPTRKRHDGDT